MANRYFSTLTTRSKTHKWRKKEQFQKMVSRIKERTLTHQWLGKWQCREQLFFALTLLGLLTGRVWARFHNPPRRDPKYFENGCGLEAAWPHKSLPPSVRPRISNPPLISRLGSRNTMGNVLETLCCQIHPIWKLAKLVSENETRSDGCFLMCRIF